MRLFKRQQEQDRDTTKLPFEYKAIVIDHPLLDTDMEKIPLKMESKIPKDAILTEGDRITPILIYRPGIESKTLIPVNSAGKAQIVIKPKGSRKKASYDLDGNWWFLTVRYVYTDDVLPATKQKKAKAQTVDEFINEIGLGHIWDTTTDMGPYQLGQDLELPEVDRLLRRARQQKLVQTLYSSVKTLTWCIFGALALFGIILISRGG